MVDKKNPINQISFEKEVMEKYLWNYIRYLDSWQNLGDDIKKPLYLWYFFYLQVSEQVVIVTWSSWKSCNENHKTSDKKQRAQTTNKQQPQEYKKKQRFQFSQSDITVGNRQSF